MTNSVYIVILFTNHRSKPTYHLTFVHETKRLHVLQFIGYISRISNLKSVILLYYQYLKLSRAIDVNININFTILGDIPVLRH